MVEIFGNWGRDPVWPGQAINCETHNFETKTNRCALFLNETYQIIKAINQG